MNGSRSTTDNLFAIMEDVPEALGIASIVTAASPIFFFSGCRVGGSACYGDNFAVSGGRNARSDRLGTPEDGSRRGRCSC